MLKVSTEVGRRLCESKGAVTSVRVVVRRGPVAFSGCLGQCAAAHNCHAMECPREIRVVLRALLLPFEERADAPQAAGSVWAQYPSSSSESMCLGWVAHDGQGTLRADG